jgi:hypothetical protein
VSAGVARAIHRSALSRVVSGLFARRAACSIARSMIRPVLVAACVATASFGGVAWADPGTHFIVELHGGIAGTEADYLDLGWSFGGVVGIGGKFRGFPPRFYVIGSYRSSFYSGEGFHYGTGVHFDAWEADHELTAGMRTAFPLWSRIFRLYFDLLGGTAGHTATLDRSEERTIQTTSWSGVFVLALGLQARWHPSASAGLRFEWSFTNRGPDLVSTAAGEEGTGTDRKALYLSNTWYF